MANTPHKFLMTLKMDDRIIVTRAFTVEEYNDDIIYSLKLNEIAKEMCRVVDNRFKENSMKKIERLLSRGMFNG